MPPPIPPDPNPGGGRDVSLEESYAGRAGRVARRSGHEPGGDTLPLGTSAETWEFHPEGSGDPEPGMTSPVLCL